MLIQTANPPPWLERFEAKIEPEPMSGCWLWTGGILPNGYGYFHPKHATSRNTHRLAWELANGSIPRNLTIDHKCRVKRCVNPAHLRLLTSRDNTLACEYAPATINANKTHCIHGHAFSGRNLRYGTKGERKCRACARVDALARYYRTEGHTNTCATCDTPIPKPTRKCTGCRIW